MEGKPEGPLGVLAALTSMPHTQPASRCLSLPEKKWLEVTLGKRGRSPGVNADIWPRSALAYATIPAAGLFLGPLVLLGFFLPPSSPQAPSSPPLPFLLRQVRPSS